MPTSMRPRGPARQQCSTTAPAPDADRSPSRLAVCAPRPADGAPMRRLSAAGNTDTNEDGIRLRLPWFLTASRGGSSRRGRGRGSPSLVPRPRRQPSMAYRGSQMPASRGSTTRPPISRRPSSTTPSSSAAAAATATPSIPSASVGGAAGTATPSSIPSSSVGGAAGTATQSSSVQAPTVEDMWTANHQKKGYMSVTVHFIDDDWRLKSFLLRFIYVPAPHTGEVISDVLHEVLQDWQIEKKVSTVTLDNCTTNDNLMGSMQDKMPLTSLMLDGRLMHMHCAAHIINLIVKDGMSVMDQGIERVRDSVGFWCATPKRHERFERTAAQMNIKYDKRIALDCKTRWNSTYLMLSTALEYQMVFDGLATREKLCATFKPTIDDWEFSRELCGRLKIFFDATELLSGTKYVTANLFFPKICGIYLAIEKWRTSAIPKVEEMSLLMKEKFNKYWADVHGLMEIATVLDPRYKLKFMKAFYTTINGGNSSAAANELSRVRSLLYECVLDYQESMEGMATTDGVGAATGNVAPNEGDDLMFGIFDNMMSDEPEVSYVRTELDLYLDEPTLPRTQELNIISWWQYAGVKYPTLRKIARDVMAIPVTTVASESVFSTGGRVISPNRSSLAPKTVEGLMCMQAWSRADMLGDQSCFVNALMTCLEDEEEMDDADSTIID